jgi:AI-2 transport protein TqsA
MQASAAIVVPFLLPVLIAIICTPPLLWMQRKMVPKLLAVTLIMVFLVGVGYWLIITIGGYIADFTEKLSDNQNGLFGESSSIVEFFQNYGIDISEALGEHFDPSMAIEMVTGFLAGLSAALTNMFLIFVIVIFILLEVSGMPDKVRAAFDHPENSLQRMERFTNSVKRYLAIKTVIAVITGILITAWLMVQGVDYAPLWGFLAFLFNFVPKIGSLIAAIPAILMAMAQLGLWHGVMAGVGFAAVNFFIGYLLEPRLMGGGLGMSTLVVFLSLIFWGWVLGPIGLILSVPLTMIFKIAMESHEETRWIGIMIDDAPEKPPD